jgi:hypothetical protein
MVRLRAADLLTADSATVVTREREAKVIALVGPNEAGKTSLIASIYEQFQKGPAGSFTFRGSETLHGFEMACHHARAVSRRAVPYTERTGFGSGLKFYHLSLQALSGKVVDVLLADRPGEDYRALSDAPSASTGFSEVTRADAIAVLVDGKRLSDVSLRHNARAHTEMTLQALVDCGALGGVRRLVLVLTKLDLVRAGDRATETEAAFAAMAERARTRHANVFQDTVAFSVAASPTSGSVARGHGVVGLLEYWLRETSPQQIGGDGATPARFFQSFSGDEGQTW